MQITSHGEQYIAENGFRFVVYDMDEAKRKPERRAIVKKYFYEKTINLIYGQSGHAKTWWCLYEAICFILGKSLLGLPIETGIGDEEAFKVWTAANNLTIDEVKEDTSNTFTQHTILYISLEMTARDIANRIEELCSGLTPQERETVKANLRIVSFEDNGNMIAGSAGFLKALEDLCLSFYFDIVYIDSFTDYIVGYDERSEDQMRRVISGLRRFTVDNGISFRIIHHGIRSVGIRLSVVAALV